jgi:hypothetical protein
MELPKQLTLLKEDTINLALYLAEPLSRFLVIVRARMHAHIETLGFKRRLPDQRSP